MNKTKKSHPKKSLVRNTVFPVPKTRLVVEEKTEKTNEALKLNKREPRSKFHSPELHSTLKLAEKIDKIGKTKSQQFDKKSEVAFCEKVTRKVNFPPDKAIYKDLIPLQVPAKTPPVLTSRDPLPLKDKEPMLSAFTKPSQVQEYISVPSVKSERHSVPPQLHSLRLYKIIQMNSQ